MAMTEDESIQTRRRNLGLTIAFASILLAQVGLYFAASADSSAATWALMLLMGAGMSLALWVA